MFVLSCIAIYLYGLILNKKASKIQKKNNRLKKEKKKAS